MLAIASFVIVFGARVALSPSIASQKEVIFQAKIEYRGLPEGLTVVGEPSTWEMKANGVGADLDQLDYKAVTASVDLSFAKVGVRTHYVMLDRDPSRGRVKIEPRFTKLRLSIEKLETITKAVKVLPVGKTPSDFMYGEATSSPETVKISGAESIVTNIDVAQVTLDLNLVKPGATFMLPVEVLDSRGRPIRNLQISPQEVAVNPAVAAAPVKRNMIISPSWVGQPAFGFEVESFEVKPNQIEIRGESGLISRTASLPTEPISVAGLKGPTTIQSKVKVLDGFETSDSTDVVVTIKVRPIAKREKGRS